MGAIASVFEAIAKRCPDNTPDPWTKDINEQRHLVVATRRVLGLDWSYKIDCNVHDHSQPRTTPDQTAIYRDATMISIPEAQASSIGGKIMEFFESPGALDLSIQGQTICPPSPCVTGPCCHVLRATHQSDFSSDRSEFSRVTTAHPRSHHCRWLSERSIPLWASHIIFLSGYQQSETTLLYSSGQEDAGLSTTASMEVSTSRHLSLILPGTKRPLTWLFI